MQVLAQSAVLVFYVLVSVSGLTLLKSATVIPSLPFFVGGVLYGIGFAIWYILLRWLPLSVAFPVAAGALMIGTQIAGPVFLGEQISALHLVGIAVLLVGVSIIFVRQ